jgi:ABC-type multidrug transport system fused ATPase/permease subunit
LRLTIKNIFLILSSQEKAKLYQLIFFDLVVSILDISFLALLIYVVGFYTGLSNVNLPVFFPVFLLKKYPLLLITLFFVLYSIKNYIAYLASKHHHQYVYDVASRISKAVLLNYLQGHYFNYVEIDSSVHIRRIGQEPIEFCHYVLKGLLQIISQFALLLITLVVILFFNAQLFILLFIVLLPPVFITGYLMKKKLNDARTNAKTASEKSLQHLQEALSGYVESNVYNKTGFFTKRYHYHQQRLNNYLSQQEIIQNLPPRIIEVFAVFGLFALVIVNSVITQSSSLHIIAVGAFMAAAYKVIPGIVKILNSIGQIKTYSFTCTDLLKHLAKPGNKIEKRDKKLNSLELANVSFNYNKAEVLKNFNLKIDRGDFVGLSGFSGKGKTTVLNLILGFLNPLNGTISMNNSSSIESERHMYWNNISYVKQHPFLINDTIISNITFADKYYDEQRLREVAEVTGVDSLASKYGSGMETLITEHGKNLSGGQRQRIALARALYKDFDLLILDEPFSELDDDSETSILKHLKEVSSKGKMVVLITHNKQSLSFCNKKVLMDE